MPMRRFGVLMRLLTVFMRRRRVRLSFLVLALGVVMGRFTMVMRCRLVMRCRVVMVLVGWMLLCH